MTPAVDPREVLEAVAGRMTRLESDSAQDLPAIDITNFECWEWPQGRGALRRPYQHFGVANGSARKRGWSTSKAGSRGASAKGCRKRMSIRWRRCSRSRISMRAVADAGARRRPCRALPRMGGLGHGGDAVCTEEGGLQHIVTRPVRERAAALWADTLFMTVLVLRENGRDAAPRRLHRGSGAAVPDPYQVPQRSPHRDTWFHGWSFTGRHNFAPRRAGPAATPGSPRGSSILSEMTPVPAGVHAYLRETLSSRRVRGLLATQADDGMWHTLLDDPASYAETSRHGGFRLWHSERRPVGPAARGSKDGRLEGVCRGAAPDRSRWDGAGGFFRHSDGRNARSLPTHPALSDGLWASLDPAPARRGAPARNRALSPAPPRSLPAISYC